MRLVSILLLALISFSTQLSWAEKLKNAQKKSPKTQEINFEEMSLQGQVRNPQGSYLVQKNGIQFMPLYDIQKSVDEKIRKSQEWMR
jgi:hypothetical protein